MSDFKRTDRVAEMMQRKLAQLVQQGVITHETAMRKAFRPQELIRLLGE